jgi:hypothetical protein
MRTGFFALALAGRKRFDRVGAQGTMVPGIPIGSPGMEQGPGLGYQRYDATAFTAAGATSRSDERVHRTRSANAR